MFAPRPAGRAAWTWQGVLLQPWTRVRVPLHGLPPFEEACKTLETRPEVPVKTVRESIKAEAVRLRSCSPPPQVTEQSDHSDQSWRTQSCQGSRRCRHSLEAQLRVDLQRCRAAGSRCCAAQQRIAVLRCEDFVFNLQLFPRVSPESSMSLRLSLTPGLKKSHCRGSGSCEPHSCIQGAGNSVPAGEHGDVADPLADSVTVFGA